MTTTLLCLSCGHEMEQHKQTELNGKHCRAWTNHGKWQYSNSTIVVPIGWLNVYETCGCRA